MATLTNIPHNPHDSQFELGVSLKSSKYYRQFVRPGEFFAQVSGGAARAAYDGTNLIQGYAAIDAADSAVTLQPIPDNFNRGEDTYLRVLFATVAGDAKNPTWLVTYLPQKIGDNFATDPGVDGDGVELDDAVGAVTDGDTGDAGFVRATAYGRIAAGAFDDADFMVAVDVECDDADSAADWFLIGMEICWPKKLF